MTAPHQPKDRVKEILLNLSKIAIPVLTVVRLVKDIVKGR